MREKIFMYLFFFAVLVCVFIYVSAAKSIKLKDYEINKLQVKLEACE